MCAAARPFCVAAPADKPAAADSYDLGGLMNRPAFAAEPQRYGLWGHAKAAAFFPSIVDTQLEPGWERKMGRAEALATRMEHFKAYVRGAAALD